MNTEDKFYFGKHGQPERFGNAGTKAESELTIRITKMIQEVEQALLSRNKDKAKALAVKVRDMIRKSANASYAKAQMEDLESIMLGISFSRVGKAERFGMAEQVLRDGSVHLDFVAARDYLAKQTVDGLRYIIKDAGAARDANGTEGRKFNYYTDLVLEAHRELKKRGFSNPGKPDEFDLSEACWDGYEPVGTKRKDGRTVPNCVPMKNEKPERFGLGLGDWKIDFRNVMKERVDQLKQLAKTLKASVKLDRISPNGYYSGSVSRKYGAMEPPDLNAPGKVKALIQSLGGYIGAAFSRPGQPERFDASSLDRKGFAAASSSPMLGKLLSEKQMPEGGWRAVETGGGSLVISFEDGDVAGNFARRVASHGYSATAPVQSIGRYWNVEVKNGK
jgi:hypothetical protein